MDFKQFLRNGLIKYWTILFVLFIVSLLFSTYFPIMMPDGFVYDYLGKMLAFTHDMSFYYLDAGEFRTPIVPIIHSYFYLFGFNYPKIIYSLFYLSIILFTYFKLNERTQNERYALIFTLILAATPVFWWRSYLTLDNLIAACYFYFGVVYWYETLEVDNDDLNRKYLLSGLCFTFAIWSRVEFLLFCIPAVIITICLNLDNNNFKKRIFHFTILPVSISLMWFMVCLFLTDWVIIKLKTYVVLLTFIFFCIILFFGNKYFKIAVLLLLSTALAILKYYSGNYFGELLSKFGNYISYFNFRFLLFFFLQGYWVFTVSLFLCIPFYWKEFDKSQKILTYFLISFYFSVVLVMSSAHDSMMVNPGEPRNYDIGIINVVKGLLLNPGAYINGSSQRIYLALYPVLVFLVAHSVYKVKIRGANFVKLYLPNIIVFGNIVLLLIIFMLPRLKFIYENPSINHEKILTTNQIKDIYNSFQDISAFAYKIKELLPQDAIVIFPSNESKGFASAKSIIFPMIGVSLVKPYTIETSLLESYKKYFKKIKSPNIYFASKKVTFPSNISSIKNTLLYDDGKWHILKLKL
ncbi:MAG: hypothetical protein CMD96_06670 [Gammaproteobacteria bacterium]|nr:hypothetical protein [Gammaproteobacteria bacterium]